MDKKGFVQVLGILFAAPYVALGTGIFLLLVLLGFYLALGKLLGAGLMVLGGLLAWRMDWKIGVPLIGVGILLFYNPFEWESLSMVPFGG